MEQNYSIPAVDILPGKKFAEGFIHDIHYDGAFIYKIAKPFFSDYQSFSAVAHELSNMRYLETHGFIVPHGYEIFRYKNIYGLRMAFVSGKTLSSNAVFENLLKSAATVTEIWAGSPDNRFESWKQYLKFTLTSQLSEIKQIPHEDCDFLFRAIDHVKNETNCLLLIDGNLSNVIVRADGSLCQLDMDRLILGDLRFQHVYLQYQRGEISLSSFPETWLDLLYAVAIVVEDIFFRQKHFLLYENEIALYMHLYNCLKQFSSVLN